MNVLEKDDHLLKTKLIFKSEEFTDEQAERAFLDTEIQSKDDIQILIDYLEKYRPTLAKKLNDKL